MPHLPGPGRPVPASTYRVQLTPQFGFDRAADLVPYLAELGVTHLYCSPYLQSAPGSQHGYDVVDHERLDADLGGPVAYLRLVEACTAAGLGVILDVVPNHMAISEPEAQNTAWWSLLRDGRASAHATWFDVDWDSPDNPGKVLVPVLGKPLEHSVEEIELAQDRLRYYDHVLPIAPGTLVDGDVLATLDRQHYRLTHWREAQDALDYRRFFDVTTLAGVRVEVPEVFDATHALTLQQLRDGVLDGLRIDHPDGLADPQGYLDRLAEATGDAWVVVEKILEHGEALPEQWRTCGTTGYDALNLVLGVLVDPAGETALDALWHARDPRSYAEVVEQSKRQVLAQVLRPEVRRLARLAVDATSADGQPLEQERLEHGLIELLVAFDVYRAYVPSTGPADAHARTRLAAVTATARSRRPDLAVELDALQSLALAERGAPEFVVRFQQTCGPVMAKGVEDTTFYRYLRLVALNEVGGDPSVFGTGAEAFHEACAATQASWPLTMTALSTHDTKRAEDVRARLVLLTEIADEWADAVARWDSRHPALDAPTRYLLWQTLVGAWPITTDRLTAYLEKASRESKTSTSWTDPDPAYDAALVDLVAEVMADERTSSEVEQLVARLEPAWHAASLAQKAVQLTMPGIPDVYQGTELPDLSLVDPDNRRPVDVDERRRQLAGLDGAEGGVHPKLRLVARVLRLRRDHPEWFLADASYRGLAAGPRALAFCRSDEVVTVVPLRPVSVTDAGWSDETVDLPDGTWRDLLSGQVTAGGPRLLRELLSAYPVSVLVRA